MEEKNVSRNNTSGLLVTLDDYAKSDNPRGIFIKQDANIKVINTVLEYFKMTSPVHIETERGYKHLLAIVARLTDSKPEECLVRMDDVLGTIEEGYGTYLIADEEVQDRALQPDDYENFGDDASPTVEDLVDLDHTVGNLCPNFDWFAYAEPTDQDDIKVGDTVAFISLADGCAFVERVIGITPDGDMYIGCYSQDDPVSDQRNFIKNYRDVRIVEI